MGREPSSRALREPHSTFEGPGRAGSKYDFVKVRVWLGEDQAHWYTLSRFLISRTLTVTQIPADKAVRIALAVKKDLVDRGRLEVSQEELESALTSALVIHGVGAHHLPRYRTVSAFFQRRAPLIVLLCGTACTGKSTIAQLLASRLNLPNVLQTDLLMEFFRGSEVVPAQPSVWHAEDEEALVSRFQAQSRQVRRGLSGDLHKCIEEGKSIIIEGCHLDPSLYLNEFGAAAVLEDAQICLASGRTSRADSSDSGSSHGPGRMQARSSFESLAAAARSSPSLLFIPVILWVDEKEHHLLMGGEAGVPGGTVGAPGIALQAAWLQRYLLRFQARGVPLHRVRPGAFQETVQALHSHVLDSIEAAGKE
ncbi:2-phosphoglycerate kinase [Auxenochlorella protothecoides]|uniref:2-phosphoglycerate kinase n=1 Tax=Auxenochlorella protothecoides TaxID=3075 RepID=A0A087SSV1_AUXPR|nr:2-phosphoglycerate kinase [Auxenochlorella protothecoides]KFM28805.1 2-phosphoglycerate kinase [Auxenochlorella protothecoides]